MKTIEDLRAVLPIAVELFTETVHNIGENVFYYEEDGWYIEVVYTYGVEYDYDPGDDWTPASCEILDTWGVVKEITANHYDEETGDDSEFSEKELAEFYTIFEELLKDIALIG